MSLIPQEDWPARRVHSADGLPRDEYADTFSDGRELEAAHAATSVGADEPSAQGFLSRYRRELVSIGIVAACALYVILGGPR